MSEAWSDSENDVVVADYMAMLANDLAGRSYSKAEHNRALQKLVGRGRGSIEYKHQNISAVLMGLGKAWIPGYNPAFNYQASLEDAVARWLAHRPGWFAGRKDTATMSKIREAGILRIDTAPALRNIPPPDESEQLARLARRFNVAERDHRNRQLGHAGEERVFQHEQETLRYAGRDDLAQKVRWVSVKDGHGLGYDILSFEPDGAERLIEVKTTNGWERTPFHISRNEMAVAEERRDNWHLLRLWNFAREPKAFALRPPLEVYVALTPSNFTASFRR